MESREVVRIIDRKMHDFEPVARGIHVRHLRLEPFLEAARRDPQIAFEIEVGYMADPSEELRDPVLVSVDERLVTTCPPLAARVLAGEPATIQRAFVEGVFLRKLFRFFVPATLEGGDAWQAAEQVREIMQRHFALQLVVAESVLSHAA